MGNNTSGEPILVTFSLMGRESLLICIDVDKF